MAECRKCGAITMYGLELAWRLQTLNCPECTTSMRLTEAEMTALREGLIEARVRIDGLISDSAQGLGEDRVRLIDLARPVD